jgi:hypothetical protein
MQSITLILGKGIELAERTVVSGEIPLGGFTT